jgi:hypothetical protein
VVAIPLLNLSANHIMRLVHIRRRTHEHPKQQDLLWHNATKLQTARQFVKLTY